MEYLDEELFLSLKQKKKILPQKKLDYMWPLISGLGWFNVQDEALVFPQLQKSNRAGMKSYGLAPSLKASAL